MLAGEADFAYPCTLLLRTLINSMEGFALGICSGAEEEPVFGGLVSWLCHVVCEVRCRCRNVSCAVVVRADRNRCRSE